jgi:hypothetical protein
MPSFVESIWDRGPQLTFEEIIIAFTLIDLGVYGRLDTTV